MKEKVYMVFRGILILMSINLQAGTVYEDGENSGVSHWRIIDNDGDDDGIVDNLASISNTYDEDRASRVIVLEGNGKNNSYIIGRPGGWGDSNAWNNKNEKILQWSMKFSENFSIYVSVQTIKGHRYLRYTNSDTNDGFTFGNINYGLGVDSNNGTWQKVTRNLEEDLRIFDTNNTIISVDAFIVRGSGRIDDISLSNLKNDDYTFIATPLYQGTMFASPSGSTHASGTKNDPYDLKTAFRKIRLGDVLFLRGGIYNIQKDFYTAIGSNTILGDSDSPYDKPIKSGTKDNYIIVESYPNERAILDGGYTDEILNSRLSNDEKVGKGILLLGSYYKIRNIEIKRMGGVGLTIHGSHNVIEALDSHHNYLSGIKITKNPVNTNLVSLNNLIHHSIFHHNSDANVSISNRNSVFTGGNQGDGINIYRAQNTIVKHNIVYNNSDDGIDTFKSVGTEISYNKAYLNGDGNGDGNGIKFMGNFEQWSVPIKVHHNISYENTQYGFNHNTRGGLIVEYNTAWNNLRMGFALLHPDNLDPADANISIQKNISCQQRHSLEDTLGFIEEKYKDKRVGVTDNSWQGYVAFRDSNFDYDFYKDSMGGSLTYTMSEQEEIKVEFISIDSTSSDFLQPKENSKFEEYGAYFNK